MGSFRTEKYINWKFLLKKKKKKPKMKEKKRKWLPVLFMFMGKIACDMYMCSSGTKDLVETEKISKIKHSG